MERASRRHATGTSPACNRNIQACRLTFDGHPTAALHYPSLVASATNVLAGVRYEQVAKSKAGDAVAEGRENFVLVDAHLDAVAHPRQFRFRVAGHLTLKQQLLAWRWKNIAGSVSLLQVLRPDTAHIVIFPWCISN